MGAATHQGRRLHLLALPGRTGGLSIARPEAGQRFAHFNVYSVLGRGGMGVVFSAFNVRDRRAVALKLLTVDPHARERFRRESQLAGHWTLRTPLPCSMPGSTRASCGWRCRCCPVRTCRTCCAARARSGRRALAIAGQVAAALDAAHDIGLIHRDVKPANVRLVEAPGAAGPRAFLGDFGLTRSVGPVDAGITHVEEIVGTGQYMVPEQVQRQRLDRRADIYSLACLLYACLSGAPPFPGRDARQVMWAQVNDPPPPLGGRGLAVGRRLEGAVLAGLAKDPARRPPTAGALVNSCRWAWDADRT